MTERVKAVWIDLDNSPHVPLFIPVIRHYQSVSNRRPLVLTARNHAQTLELLQNAGLDHQTKIIGLHYGKSKVLKLYGLAVRALQLAAYIRTQKKNGIDVAVALSHGSRTMVIAAWLLGIPVITMYDYEFTETKIFNTLSEMVLVPEKIPDMVLDRIGLDPKKRFKYKGYKEELYLHDYRPDEHFWRKVETENNCRIDTEKIIVTLRPPASTANYHNEQSEAVLKSLIEKLLGREDVFTLILPRTPEQRREIETFINEHAFDAAHRETNYLIPKRAINGLDLAYASDLLISGGGTMNREAALLGVPVYSIFAGEQGALDQYMEEAGMIRFIRSPEAIERIVLRKRLRGEAPHQISQSVEKTVIEKIEMFTR
ncbi:MAG: DUF354 domain-containing protein [Rhizobacter sp.]|nr:DUF354 domain-containing protein [Chlorobiales bacterium]